MKDEKIDLLINLVYAEPAIWDLRSDAYKNRDKSVLWARIAKKAGFKGFKRNSLFRLS
jgi:hypothetical protein